MPSKFNIGILISAKDQASAVVGKVGGVVEANAAKFRKVGAIATAAGGAIVGSLALIAKQTAKTGDELAKASAKTGVGVESLSRLRFAAEQSGVGFSELEMAIARQSRAASEASEGVATYADAYNTLGVSVTGANGELKDGETLFRETAEALSKIENPTKRSALAMDIFGRSGANMLPLLNQGAAGIDELGKRAHELGIVFDAESAAASERFNDSLNEVKLSLGGAARQIGQVLLPVLAPLAEKIATVIGQFAAWADKHPHLTRALTLGAGAIGVLLSVLGPLLIILPSLTSGWGLLTGAIAAFPGIIAGIGPALVGAFAAIGPAGWIILAIGALAAGVALVIRNWDKIKGFFVNLWGKVKDIFAKHWEKILAVIFPGAGIVFLFAKHWDQITDFFANMWDKVKGVFSGVWDWMKNAGRRLWDAFVEGLKSAAGPVYKAVEWALSKVSKLMPKSDADEGPLSHLTQMGAAIPKTLAKGVDAGRGALKGTMADALGGRVMAYGGGGAGGGGGGALTVRIEHGFPSGTHVVDMREVMRHPEVERTVNSIVRSTATRVPGQYDFSG
jgi:TP901 family phage tail tape measure protein